MSLKKTYKKVKGDSKRLNEELEMIQRLGLTKEQKNALFHAAGEAMAKLPAEKFVAIMQACCPETVVDGDLNKATAKVVAESSIDEMKSILSAMVETSEADEDVSSLEEMIDVLTEADDEDEDDSDKDEDEDSDKDDEEDKKEKVKVEESLKAIFGSDLLTEETQTKLTALFEAAVSEKVQAVQADLEAQAVSEVSAIVESIEIYLEEAANEFIEKNKIALEQGIRVEIMEGFMGGIKGLIESHNLAIDTEQVDLVEELAAKVESLEAKLDESLNEKVALKGQVESNVKATAIAEAGKDLTVSQQEKLAALAEDLEFTTADKYAAKLEIIVEQYFSTPVVDAPVVVEGVLTEEKEIDAGVNTYANVISRTLKK